MGDIRNCGRDKKLWEKSENCRETKGFGERQEMWERMENFKKRRVTYGRRTDYFYWAGEPSGSGGLKGASTTPSDRRGNPDKQSAGLRPEFRGRGSQVFPQRPARPQDS